MSRYDPGPTEGAILPNKLGLTSAIRINEEELVGFVRAELEAIDALGPGTEFSLAYLCDLHKKSLGHLYEFAGKLRTVDLSKHDFAFPAAKFLLENMSEFERRFLLPLNERDSEDDTAFLRHIADLHAELLYLHPFREGNGRVIRLFTKLIMLAKTGKELSFEHINQSDNFKRYVAAVQQAAKGEYTLMEQLFAEMEA